MNHPAASLRLAASLGLAWLASSGTALAATSENYIGAERCRACHEFEYQVWERSAHKRSQVSLSDQQRADPKCNTCHTTSAETGNQNTSIDCERCHGPGKYYYPRYVMKDRELARAVFLVEPKPEHCTQCHTEGTPSIRPFNFDEMWAKIDHGKAAREAWEKARARDGAAASPAAGSPGAQAASRAAGSPAAGLVTPARAAGGKTQTAAKPAPKGGR